MNEDVLLNSVRKYPYAAYVGLTYACNCRCVHCYARERVDACRDRMDLKDYYAFYDWLYENNCWTVTYSHGETLLSPILDKVMQYGHEKGFTQTLISNGLKTLSLKEFNYYADMGVDTFLLSLDSLERDKHNTNRNNKDAFQGLTASIENLSKSKIITKGISTSISTYNEDELEDIVDYAIKMGMDMISLLTERTNLKLANINLKNLVNIIRRKSCDIRILTHDKRLIDSVNDKDFDVAIDYQNFIEQNSCYQGKYMISIDTYGDIRSCNFCDSVYGNFLTDEIDHMWCALCGSNAQSCYYHIE